MPSNDRQQITLNLTPEDYDALQLDAEALGFDKASSYARHLVATRKDGAGAPPPGAVQASNDIARLNGQIELLQNQNQLLQDKVLGGGGLAGIAGATKDKTVATMVREQLDAERQKDKLERLEKDHAELQKKHEKEYAELQKKHDKLDAEHDKTLEELDAVDAELEKMRSVSTWGPQAIGAITNGLSGMFPEAAGRIASGLAGLSGAAGGALGAGVSAEDQEGIDLAREMRSVLPDAQREQVLSLLNALLDHPQLIAEATAKITAAAAKAAQQAGS